MTNDTSTAAKRQKLVTHGFLIPFILVTSLFFLWGFAHSLLDVLNKHFQDILGILFLHNINHIIEGYAPQQTV